VHYNLQYNLWVDIIKLWLNHYFTQVCKYQT